MLILCQYALSCFPLSNLTEVVSSNAIEIEIKSNQNMFQMCELGNTVYNSNWYLCDNLTKTMVQLMIVRAQKPFYVTAGGFINIDKNNFTQVY